MNSSLIKKYTYDPNELFFRCKIIPGVVRKKIDFVQIETCARCNLACIACDVHRRLKKKAFMDLNTFKKVIKNFPDLKRVDLVGIGEPLLNPHLPSIIDYATKKGIKTEIYSNGTLFREKLIPCINAGLSFLNVSIDAANLEIFEKYRRGAKFRNVVDNIVLADNYIKKTKKDLVISFNCMMSRNNWNELPGIVELAHNLNIKNITMDPIHQWGGGRSDNYNISFFGMDRNYALKIAEEAAVLADKYKINLYMPALDRIGDEDKFDEYYCTWPWNTPSIKINGDIAACTLTEDKNMIFGNILKTPLKKIWNNKKYNAFRDTFFTKNRYKVCKNCQMLLSWGLHESKLLELRKQK